MGADSGVKTYSAATISEKMNENTILFMDATGLGSISDSTSIGIIKLFECHQAFISHPYIWTGINYESVLISAYQILKDAYGLLDDATFKQKVNNVNEKFLGSSDSNRQEETSKSVPLPTAGTSIYDDESAVVLAFRGYNTHGALTVNGDGTISVA